MKNRDISYLADMKRNVAYKRRRPLLYPTELRVQINLTSDIVAQKIKNGKKNL